MLGKSTLLLITATLCACSSKPENIAANAVSPTIYQGRSCAELSAEHETTSKSLAAAEEQQTITAGNDAFGVFMIGVPIGKMSGGDRAPDIAQYKGQLIAIGSAMVAKGCPPPPTS